MIEQLAAQLAQLAKQARQAQRYREIGEKLRLAEGMLLYRRWREADEARLASEDELRVRVEQAVQGGGAGARRGCTQRGTFEEKLPPLREEEAIAAAILQRLVVQRDSLGDQEAQARQTIERLSSRIVQLGNDIERETGLNKDAGRNHRTSGMGSSASCPRPATAMTASWPRLRSWRAMRARSCRRAKITWRR